MGFTHMLNPTHQGLCKIWLDRVMNVVETKKHADRDFNIVWQTLNIAIVDIYLKKENDETIIGQNNISLTNLQAGTMLCVKNEKLWGDKSAKVLDMVKNSMKRRNYSTVMELVWRKWR